jgi:hypothetical protein
MRMVWSDVYKEPGSVLHIVLTTIRVTVNVFHSFCSISFNVEMVMEVCAVLQTLCLKLGQSTEEGGSPGKKSKNSPLGRRKMPDNQDVGPTHRGRA